MRHHHCRQQCSHECADVQHRHVGCCRLRAHLLLGFILERDPLLDEQNWRVPEPAKGEYHDSGDQNCEVVGRGEVHCKPPLGIGRGNPQRIYVPTASLAAVQISRMAAAAAAPSVSTSGSYADRVTPAMRKLRAMSERANSTSSIVRPPRTESSFAAATSGSRTSRSG